MKDCDVSTPFTIDSQLRNRVSSIGEERRPRDQTLRLTRRIASGLTCTRTSWSSSTSPWASWSRRGASLWAVCTLCTPTTRYPLQKSAPSCGESPGLCSSGCRTTSSSAHPRTLSSLPARSRRSWLGARRLKTNCPIWDRGGWYAFGASNWPPGGSVACRTLSRARWLSCDASAAPSWTATRKGDGLSVGNAQGGAGGQSKFVVGVRTQKHSANCRFSFSLFGRLSKINRYKQISENW